MVFIRRSQILNNYIFCAHPFIRGQHAHADRFVLSSVTDFGWCIGSSEFIVARSDISNLVLCLVMEHRTPFYPFFVNNDSEESSLEVLAVLSRAKVLVSCSLC